MVLPHLSLLPCEPDMPYTCLMPPSPSSLYAFFPLTPSTDHSTCPWKGGKEGGEGGGLGGAGADGGVEGGGGLLLSCLITSLHIVLCSTPRHRLARLMNAVDVERSNIIFFIIYAQHCAAALRQDRTGQVMPGCRRDVPRDAPRLLNKNSAT